jgi:hypothetical protein
MVIPTCQLSDSKKKTKNKNNIDFLFISYNITQQRKIIIKK